MPVELDVIRFVTDLLMKFLGLRAEEKAKFATCLDETADCLSEFGQAFRQHDEAKMAELAAQTEVLAARFSDVSKGILSPSDIATLQPKLTTAAIQKQLLSKSSDEHPRELDEIAQTAGVFRAFAVLLKTGTNKLR